jgi:hypothetical protein
MDLADYTQIRQEQQLPWQLHWDKIKMANTFTRYVAKDVGTGGNTLVTAGDATQTTVIGLSLANTTNSAITANVFITASAVDYYIVKDVTIASGASLALFGGDGKLVLNTGDAFKVQTNTASSADAIISVLQIT